MKILMLNHEFPPVGGGAAPVTFELCKHLVGMGHIVDVVTMHYGDLPGFECVDGVNIYRTPALRKRPDICYTHEMATYLPGAIFKTLGLAGHREYDFIHCHFILPGGPLAWMVGKLKKLPFLVTCHGSDNPGYNPDRFGLTHKMLLPAWRFLVRRADVLVSPSRWLKELIQSNCPDIPVRIIPNGIYHEQFTPKAKSKSILMCSRILPRKGFQYVIEAIKDIEPGWEVNVVGEGPYLGELKKLAAGAKTPIKFWGWIDPNDRQLKTLYETSSIFVFPSEAENFPSVLLEAMSAGMAIITSTAGGCGEVVGDAGVLVEPRDSNAIGAKLREFIGSQQLREQLGLAARQRVKEFSWPNIANQYIECYHAVIEQRNKRCI